MTKNWVKIRGIIGLFVFIITLILTKIATIYDLFQNHRLLAGLLLFVILITSLALYTRYNIEKNKKL